MISTDDKRYLISSRLKNLEGLKNRKNSQDPEVFESIEDLNSQIQALTNMLEML
jgi:hypothetical protein